MRTGTCPSCGFVGDLVERQGEPGHVENDVQCLQSQLERLKDRIATMEHNARVALGPTAIGSVDPVFALAVAAIAGHERMAELRLRW